MDVAIVCAALLGALLFGLGLAVSLTRGATNTSAGYSSDPSDKLHKAVRAHGNTSEYVAMLAVLILALGAREPTTWGIVCMIGATLSRYLLAAGVLLGGTLDKPHPLRFVGALGTYVFGLGLCVLLLLSL